MSDQSVLDGARDVRQLTFAELLRSQRLSRGVTQRQLADLSTISVRAIRDLELGLANRPRRDTVRLICEGLGLIGRERVELELAARQVSTPGTVKMLYDAEPVPPPAPLGEIVGREAELAVLADLLTTGSQRLVTVTGLCGVGKTMLAMEAAGALHRTNGFPVLWSSAAGGTTPTGPAQHRDQLAALIDTGISGLFAEAEPSVAQLRALIGQRPTLLVLDGYDPHQVRMDQVVALLQDCRELRVLATARTPFDVRGERVVPLTPLPTPAAGRDYNLATLGQMPAVRLLTSHAREIHPDFTLDSANAPAVAALVRRLDGIPAVLVATASWFLLDEPAGVLAFAEHDPFGLIADALPDLRASLARTVTGLGRDAAAVLDALSTAPPGWSIADAVGLTEVSPVACARLVRRLLLLGLIRPADETDRTRFQVLVLVRALLGTCSADPVVPAAHLRAAEAV